MPLLVCCKDYELSTVTGDNYSAEWVETAFRDAGISYRAQREAEDRVVS